MSGFVALHRSEETLALLENYPNAYLLLNQIAIRARWVDCPVTGLKKGQARIGDWRKAGLKSPKAYEVAKKRLKKCQFAGFQGGNKGTVATLLNTKVFSITAENGGSQGGTQGEPRGKPGGTNNKETRNKETTNTKEESLTAPSLPHGDLFSKAWKRWEQHRKELKKPLKPTMTEGQLANLSKMTEPEAVAMIEHTITMGWQGLRSPDPTTGKASRPNAEVKDLIGGRTASITKACDIPHDPNYIEEEIPL